MLLRRSRAVNRLGAIVMLCLGLAAAHAAAAPPPSPPVRGLIVKLRDADGERAHALAATDAASHAAARGARMRGVLDALGMARARTRGVAGVFEHVEFGAGLQRDEAERVAARLRERPEVEWVVPNEIERRLVTPTDPQFLAGPDSDGQWWLFPSGGSNGNDIELRRRGLPGVQSAWSTQTGQPAARVAVLDTGITDHPDLDAHLLPGRDFVSTVEYAGDGDGWDADPHDRGDGVTEADRTRDPGLFGDCELTESSWHGTTIAGMIAGIANNAQFGAAVSLDARVVPVRVAGKCGAAVSDILDGMRWAAGLEVRDGNDQPLPPNPYPARIISISFGGSAACNAAYQETIDAVRAAGVLVVAAAGNENGAVVRPASCRGVLAVTALNRDGFKASYANFGSAVGIATVGGDPRDLGAWGMWVGDTGLLVLGNDGLQSPGEATSVRVAGTSFAAPIVAGVASLMLSVRPTLTVDQLIAGIQRSARPHVVSARIGTCSAQNPGRCMCRAATCGAGILDAPQALAYAQQPDSYTPPARTAENVDSDEVIAAVALGPDLPPNDPADNGSGSDGGGGGALGAPWLALLLAALVALVRAPRRR